MKRFLIFLLASLLAVPAFGQVRKQERKSLLESDPEVVYLDQEGIKTIELVVIKEAPVFSDKAGSQKLGVLVKDQKVKLEAMTERAYKVRGQGQSNGITGWVAPWAFASKDPQFVENLKKLYQRQQEVKALIAAKQVAIGMSMSEVQQVLGKPTKTQMRRTDKGESGSWEFIEYEEIKNYATVRNPVTGQFFRQLTSVTQEEKNKTRVEFEGGVVSAVEESESSGGGQVKVIVPPIFFGW